MKRLTHMTKKQTTTKQTRVNRTGQAIAGVIQMLYEYSQLQSTVIEFTDCSSSLSDVE